MPVSSSRTSTTASVDERDVDGTDIRVPAVSSGFDNIIREVLAVEGSRFPARGLEEVSRAPARKVTPRPPHPLLSLSLSLFFSLCVSCAYPLLGRIHEPQPEIVLLGDFQLFADVVEQEATLVVGLKIEPAGEKRDKKMLD